MSLTDDWKAGKLEDGLYYIRLEDDKTPIAELETWCRYDEVEERYKMAQEFFGYPKNIISEVLSPVPSYDHFVGLNKKAKKFEKEYAKALQYNDNLSAVITGHELEEDYPLRHDKTAYELQVELNRLREENAKMFNLLEMVARGITLYCDTEDVIKITSDVKKFCIAKHESEGK